MEDQEDKYKHIKSVLEQYHMELIWKTTCQSGLMALLDNNINILLLDMSMPISENEPSKDNFDNYAGMSVMREIKRKKYDLKVIVITGFDDFQKGNDIITLTELDNEIKVKYNAYYLGCVRYDSTSIEWQEKLLTLLGAK
jgi:DNA-binding response OmpR family regulator